MVCGPKCVSLGDGKYEHIQRAGCAVAVSWVQSPRYYAFPARLARQAYKLGAGGVSKLPGTSPCENKAQQGERMHIWCFYFISPFISMPTRLEHLGVDKCTLTHMHTVPLSLARVCDTHMHTPPPPTVLRKPDVDTIVSLLCVVHPPFATNPCPFHTKLPVGKTHNFYTTQP